MGTITGINALGTHELHSDHLGTPRVITTASGGTAVIEGRQNYGPYGETFPAMDSGYAPLTGYTGHVQTDPTGLIYMRGRFYTPIWHRFVNSDQGADPSTWNQMSYVGGSPMMATDPSGMIAAEGEAICSYGERYEYHDGQWVDAGLCHGDEGGSATVEVNGGHPDDVPYAPDFSWDAPPLSPVPTNPFTDQGGGEFPSLPRKLFPYDDCVQSCRHDALTRYYGTVTIGSIPFVGFAYTMWDSTTGGPKVFSHLAGFSGGWTGGSSDWGPSSFGALVNGRIGDYVFVKESEQISAGALMKGALPAGGALGKALPLINAAIAGYQERKDLDDCVKKCNDAYQKVLNQILSH